MSTELWVLVDRQTRRRYGYGAWLTRAGAEGQVTAWQDRHDEGGRLDIPRETLLNLTPELMSA